MNWETIRLELADTREYPGGSVSRGYLIRLPLTDDGTIDEGAIAKWPKRATVRRFWSTEPDENGRVVRVDGQWALRCSGSPDRLLFSNRFLAGEQVALSEPHADPLPFRVANIRRLG